MRPAGRALGHPERVPTVSAVVVPSRHLGLANAVEHERVIAGGASGQAPAFRGRIPSLDGLRAISIALVLTSHTFMGAEAPNSSWRYVFSVLGNGNLGVQVFFIISGFLISTLLLDEIARCGRIDLKTFYIRRSFRIFPAYYTFLAVVGLLAATHHLDVRPRDFLHAGTFTWIYNYTNWNWYLSHTWSLSVEEQFYLLWPAALLIFGRRNGVWIAIALIITVPLARGGFVVTTRGALHRLCAVVSAGRFDTLMFGCLTALLWRSPRFHQAISSGRFSVLTAASFMATVLAASLASLYPDSMNVPVAVMTKDTIVGFGVALTMIWLITRPSSLAGRVLNWRPLVVVGTLSYSLYLWQQLFLTPNPNSVIQQLPLNLLCVVLTACASFYLVERPCQRLRLRLSRDPATAKLGI